MSGEHRGTLTVPCVANKISRSATGKGEESRARLPVESSAAKCRHNSMETLHQQRNLCPSQYRTNPLSCRGANMLVSFMGNRDGDLTIENEFTLGMRCMEQSRYSTDEVVILVPWIRWAGRSKTR